MKFETRLEAKVLIPIIALFVAQIAGAVAWGGRIQERVARVEEATTKHGEALDEIKGKIETLGANIDRKFDGVNDKLIQLIRDKNQ